MAAPVPTALPTSPASTTVVSHPLMRAAPLAAIQQQMAKDAAETQAQPLLIGLAGHVRKCWSAARQAKLHDVEPRMLKAVRSRRGEYEPEVKSEIARMGGSSVYAMVTSVKCRAAGSWIKDVLLATGSERPWTVRPTPMPDLPPEVNEQIVGQASQAIMQAQMAGVPVDEVQLVKQMRDNVRSETMKKAFESAERMAEKMEDQLIEGGFYKALEDFVDDLATFPAAVLKGPVVRMRKRLAWPQGGGAPTVEKKLVLEWERVDPFDVYPSPSATGVDDGYFIERHKLSRADLQALIGVEGYHDASIRQVLDHHGRGGLQGWLSDDASQAQAEGKSVIAMMDAGEALIDALQFWGSVQGKHLIDWGLTEEEVSDPLGEYECEVWLIGNTVIKAMINPDPLGRRPYYKASYEDVPGSFWGNGVPDLVRDSQTVINAAARAIVNNMGIASGPQVVVNIDRLAAGEDLTTMTPWKIWQVTNDPIAGGAGSPITFNQPSSNVQELMAVFERFSQLADEYSGIPRYLTGDTTGGAGRTASGLSMLINNAGKSIKQVIANIDVDVMEPLLNRLYSHNMVHAEDPTLKGDVDIVARGSSALIAKEAAQLRRNEFLRATSNPVDMQITGIEGRAYVLREVAKGLDLDVDKIVPPPEVLAQKLMAMQIMQQQQAQAEMREGPEIGGGEQLEDGTPTTDNFSPTQEGA